MGPIQLVLEQNEAALVDDALQRILHHLRTELVHTDDRELKANLRRQIGELEVIETRLSNARRAA